MTTQEVILTRLPTSPHCRTVSQYSLFVEICIYFVVEDYFYLIDQDDTVEDENLAGEDDEEDSESAPIRYMSDFTIYDLETFQAISIGELLQMEFSTKKYGASGLVKPWVVEDSDSDEDSASSHSASSEELSGSWQRVTLSRITEFNIHHWDGSCLDRSDSSHYMSYWL